MNVDKLKMVLRNGGGHEELMGGRGKGCASEGARRS